MWTHPGTRCPGCLFKGLIALIQNHFLPVFAIMWTTHGILFPGCLFIGIETLIQIFGWLVFSPLVFGSCRILHCSCRTCT